MRNQHLLSSTAVVLLTAMILLSSCSPGGLFSGDLMYTPHREVPADVQILQEALTALSEGDRAGRIVLTEAEFTALLHLFLVGIPINMEESASMNEPSNILRDVNVRFEPDTVTLKAVLAEGFLPVIPSDVSINVDGEFKTTDNRLLFKVNRIGIGVFPIVSPALQSLLEEEITDSFGLLLNRSTPLNVTVNSGSITIIVP